MTRALQSRCQSWTRRQLPPTRRSRPETPTRRRRSSGTAMRLHAKRVLLGTLACAGALGMAAAGALTPVSVTLMRAAPGQPWLRIEGFVTPYELVGEYRKLLASR